MKRVWVYTSKDEIIPLDVPNEITTHGLVIGNGAEAKGTDPVGEVVDLGISQVDPLVNKSSLFWRSAEEARVGGKAGNCKETIVSVLVIIRRHCVLCRKYAID